MAVIASDDFSGVTTAALTGRTLNNALGGTGSRTWASGSGIQFLNGNNAGALVSNSANAASFVSITGANKARVRVNPNGAANNLILWGRRDLLGNGSATGIALLFAASASLRVSEFAAGSRTDHVSLGVTAPTTNYWMELEVNGLTVTCRILNNDTSVRDTVSHTFSGSVTSGGDNWGFGFFQNGSDAIFEDFVADDGGASDAENPGLTGALSVVSKTSTSISVTGPTGTDNVGVVAYEFSQDGGATWPFSETTPAHVYTGLTQLTSYDLRMRAKDAAGNISNVLSLTTSTYRAGALGSTILLTTGPVDGNPAGILHNDVATDGSDDNKWFSFRIISQTLNGGTLNIDPDGTFTFTGAASGNFTYQLEVDGVDVGSPQLVTLYDLTSYRPSGDVTTTGWTSTGANFYDQLNETPSNDSSFVTSPPLGATTDPLTLDIASMSAGNYIARFRARKTQTTGEVRMVFLGAGGASVGETAWQPVTTSFALYELPVTLTATSARVRLDVRE